VENPHLPMHPQIVWFKRDLRLHDHAPLLAAAARGPVLPLYIVEPQLWTQADSSSRHWQFIQSSLRDLQNALRSLGGLLQVERGEAIEVLRQLKTRIGPFALWSHEETGNAWTFARDRQVASWCRTEGIRWQELPANGVVRHLRNRDGWAAARNAVMQAPRLAAPTQLRFFAIANEEQANDRSSAALEEPLVGMATAGRVQAGGRREGLAVLESFLQSRSSRYMRTISKPGISVRHCSRLSAHIAYGTLSVREIDQATAARQALLASEPNPGSADWAQQLQAFRSRLAWRCHFVQKLEQQPAIEFRCMHPAFEGMRESEFRADFFDAWHAGRTGYPLIDACMRSLQANGWITFRMRALLVSFASYHLWLDWRRTAPVLAQLFTDYEPGIHYSQFQMQSGVTGINAVRMYNPVKQSIEHDPEGKFIRRYLPELRNLPDELIHEPWKADSPPRDYPPPVVDHEATARAARQKMAPYWRGEDFRDQAQEVFRRLGSRNRPTETRRRAEARATTKAKAATTATTSASTQMSLGLDEAD